MKGYVEKQIVDLGDHGEQIEQYGIFESTERAEGNVIGIFSCEETRIRVKAFVLDEEEVMVRFRPERTGIWEYRIQAGETILREGSFLCIQAGEGNHGPVSAAGFGVRDREGNLCRIHKEAADPSI